MPPHQPKPCSGLGTATREARAQGADLLITPEMALTGYAIGADQVAALAEPADGPMAQAVADIAQRHGLAVVYGYPERNPHGQPFNAAQAIAPDARGLLNHRKTHLYGELDRAQFSAGDRPLAVVDWRGWQLGLLICYDVEFPETVRTLAQLGADAVLVPTANMLEFDEVPQQMVLRRARENRLCIAYANACGHEPGLEYGGLSTAVGPDGSRLALAGRSPTLLTAVLPGTTQK